MARRDTQKRARGKTKTKRVFPYRLVIIIIILAMMVFSFLPGTGVIGKYLGNFSRNSFGVFAIPVYLCLLAICAFLPAIKTRPRFRKNVIYIGLLLMMLMVLIDVTLIPAASFAKRMEGAKHLAQDSVGAGLFGNLIGYVFAVYLGKIGSFFIFVILLFFANLSFFNFTLKEFFGMTQDRMFAWKEKRAERKAQRERQEDVVYDEREPEDDREVSLGTPGNEDLLDDENFLTGEADHFVIHNHNEYPQLSFAEEASESGEKQLTMIEPEEDTKVSSSIATEEEITGVYESPSIELLSEIKGGGERDHKELQENARKIVQTLSSFGIEGTIQQINQGPTVTCYELSPAPGVRVSRIVNLADNIALNLASSGIRIEAPMPGKAAVGIEVPNQKKDMVSIRELLDHSAFKNADFALPFAVGKNIFGAPIIAGLEKMPHLLVAGATGSGKSVCINTLILSILYTKSPSECKLLLIDPKVVELSVYNGIPHLISPVVTNPRKANNALGWAVGEMDRRYRLFAEEGVRDYIGYREKAKKNGLEEIPYIVIIIDELADLMMEAAKEVEAKICRIAQLARACGIHLVLATQRPSVDVITGTIKANIPSRISFQVSSQIDSRTILDGAGAEKLLGKGDMLFSPSNLSKPVRVQGAFVSDDEVQRVVDFLKSEHEPRYDASVERDIESDTSVPDRNADEDADELIPDAIEVVLSEGQASVSQIQRKLKVGYARAGRIIDTLETMGIVGPHEGSKPRRVLVGPEYLDEQREANDESTQ